MDLKFRYREVFTDPKESFSFSLEPINDIKDTCLFVLDANVLLTPLTTGSKSLEAIRKIYLNLQKQDRVFVPSQAAREFVGNRATKLTELHDSLYKKLNQSFNYVENHPLLEEFEDLKELIEIEQKLKDQIKTYRKQIQKVISIIQSWGWNDPVSKMYKEVLGQRVLSDENLKYDEIEKDLKRRFELKIPPGFKDQSKPENSSGDLVIWHEILELGKVRKENLAFVSGDEKSDWWYQSSKHPLYPKIELVDEYRRVSANKSFHIISLSKLLQLFEADQEVVQEVKKEENISSIPLLLENQIDKESVEDFIKRLEVFIRRYKNTLDVLAEQQRTAYSEASSNEEYFHYHTIHRQREATVIKGALNEYDLYFKKEALTLRNFMVEKIASADVGVISIIADWYQAPKDFRDLELILQDIEYLFGIVFYYRQ